MQLVGDEPAVPCWQGGASLQDVQWSGTFLAGVEMLYRLTAGPGNVRAVTGPLGMPGTTVGQSTPRNPTIV
jgi:hypothetical protein